MTAKRTKAMAAETLKALKGSIRKWERIVDGTGSDQGTKNCPLCQLFWSGDCLGCPIREQTGDPYCLRTPYELFVKRTEDDKGTGRWATNSLAKYHARRMLAFLKRLLPKPRPPRKKVAR